MTRRGVFVGGIKSLNSQLMQVSSATLALVGIVEVRTSVGGEENCEARWSSMIRGG
jgi:hypothetical protein